MAIDGTDLRISDRFWMGKCSFGRCSPHHRRSHQDTEE
jgi:hypothetical protein